MKGIVVRNKRILMAAALVLSCLLLASCGGKKDQVRVFCYGDYMDPEVVESFEEETGLTVKLDTFDTCEEMYPIVKNRAGVYDVICASDYMIERMKSEGLLQEIDTASMENYDNIGETYLEMSASFDPDNKYSVPYQWGTLGILYNAGRLGEGSVTSWNDLWDPKHKGKIIMQDSLRDTLAVGLKSLGYSLNTDSETELSRAVDKLIEQKPLIYKYANDSARDLLIGGSADLGVVWNGEYLYSKELNEDLDFVVPKEGTEIFVDSWVIPFNAFQKKNGELFIDYMCREDVALKNYEYLTYSTPNDAARKLMPKEESGDSRLFPGPELLKKSESLRDLGPDTDEVYSTFWKRFKSS